MSHPFHIVDVFAEQKYAGNQLAVVSAAGDLSTAVMQRIARETNFSETTFIVSEPRTDQATGVRIFTPGAELPFAGHPTLGTAWVIRSELLRERPKVVTLDLPIGPVPVRFAAESSGGELAWMRPPLPELGPVHRPDDVAALVGLTTDEIDSGFPVQTVSVGIAFTMIPVRSLASMRRARVNTAAIERLTDAPFPLQFFLFAPETYHAEHQINARMFAAHYGVPEDPATGSANACLGVYLARHHYFGSGTIDVRVEQGYEIGRRSLLFVRAGQDSEGLAVEVGGHVVLVARGELL